VEYYHIYIYVNTARDEVAVEGNVVRIKGKADLFKEKIAA
jgi:hypothetical protein